MAVVLAVLLLLVTLFVLCAPGFLFTGDLPSKADAVVLFVGPGNRARLEESRQLLKEGYARYLLIPSSGEVFMADPAGGMTRLAGTPPDGKYTHWTGIKTGYRKHYENTHIEALEAKRMLDGLGLRSALLVSSGYHMRRIRLIAGRVFDADKYSFRCNPAKWQAEYTAADWLDREHREMIVSEYVKMVWFLVYGVAGTRQMR